MAKLKSKDRQGVGSQAENEFGEFLRSAREKKDYTLQQVADTLGLKSPQPVWDWENGKGSGIPAEMLLRLVEVYKISSSQAYEQLMKFHQNRTREKIHEKFEQARAKVMGLKRG